MSEPAAIVLLGPSGLDVARRIAAALPHSELYGAIGSDPGVFRDRAVSGFPIHAAGSVHRRAPGRRAVLQRDRDPHSGAAPSGQAHRAARRHRRRGWQRGGAAAGRPSRGQPPGRADRRDPWLPRRHHHRWGRAIRARARRSAAGMARAEPRDSQANHERAAARPGRRAEGRGGAPGLAYRRRRTLCQPRRARGPHHRSRRSRIGHPSGHSPQGARSWRRLRARHGGGGASGSGGFDAWPSMASPPRRSPAWCRSTSRRPSRRSTTLRRSWMRPHDSSRRRSWKQRESGLPTPHPRCLP